ncbi:transposase [Bradyrhizobium sp. RDM4]
MLAFMSFPSQHRTKLHCANLIERLNEEINGGPRVLAQ